MARRPRILARRQNWSASWRKIFPPLAAAPNSAHAVFIDATYEGDLAALAGVPYRVGRESRQTFGEPHAGNIYVRFGDHNPLPGSTGEADAGIQAFCFRFHLTQRQSQFGADRTARGLSPRRLSGRCWPTSPPEKSRGWIRSSSSIRCRTENSRSTAIMPIPTPACRANRSTWPKRTGAGPKRGRKSGSGCLLVIGRTTKACCGCCAGRGRAGSIREEARQWGFPKDEFVDHRHRPHHLYVRQGRRIWGEYNFTERDADRDFATGLPKRKPDGIAVAEFEFDSHAVHKFDDAHPGVREGYFFVAHEPLQLPYRICVPKCVDGLLVPVACSASHVGYQTIRMEPVFMALGEACGIAAKIAQQAGGDVRSVDVAALQREILRRGGVILYECAPLQPEGL